VDVMRLWIAAHASASHNVPVSDALLKLTKHEADRLRNVCKYLLGNITTLKSKSDLIDWEEMAPMDRYVMARTAEYYEDVSAAYNEMQYNKVKKIALLK
jgi:isoleucyl-tRNA synthetase